MGGCSVYTGRGASTAANEALALSESLLSELEEADEYAIGVPMHNFGIPSVLKLWIYQICRVGRTFAYVDGAAQSKVVRMMVPSAGQITHDADQITAHLVSGVGQNTGLMDPKTAGTGA